MATDQFWEDFRDSGEFDPDKPIDEQLEDWLGYDPYTAGKGNIPGAIKQRVERASANTFNDETDDAGKITSRQVNENQVKTEKPALKDGGRAKLKDDDFLRVPSQDTTYIKAKDGRIPAEKVHGAFKRVYRSGNEVSSRQVVLQGKDGKIIGRIDR